MSISEKELCVYFEGVLVMSQIMNYIDNNQKKIGNKYKVDSDKCYDNHDPNIIGEVMYREQAIMRRHIRFTMLKEYIEKFIIKNVNSFDDLLQYGRETLLYQYNNHNKYNFYIDNGTGIEPSLFNTADWPIKQMIELNHYMFTHTSTNYPTDDTFQEMFLIGYFKRDIMQQMKEELDQTELVYRIKLEPTINYDFEGLIKDGKSSKNLEKAENADSEVSESSESSDSSDSSGPREQGEVIYQPYGLETKEWKDQLCELLVIDPNITNRNLYIRILEIFQKISIQSPKAEATK